MTPRPILKTLPDVNLETVYSSPLPFASCSQMLHSPHVHFPPTPTLTTTAITHSPFIYDRAPITVPDNMCAMPKRGARVYSTAAPKGIDSAPLDSYFHPRAFQACNNWSRECSPPLLDDLNDSPDSDASDPLELLEPPFIPSHPTHDSLSSGGVNTNTVLLCSPFRSPLVESGDNLGYGKRYSWKHSDRTLAKAGRHAKAVISAFQEHTLDGCLGGF